MLLSIRSTALLAIYSLVTATPTPRVNTTSGGPLNDFSDDFKAQYKLYGFVGCSAEEQHSIYAAFQEKDQIVGCQNVKNIDWGSAAAVDYFG
jgi:hypothetical protein